MKTFIYSKQCWVVWGQIWVKCWVKNAIKKITVEIWNYIFNPTFGFVRILPKFGLKQPSIV